MAMSKDEFRRLFLKALAEAAENVELTLARSIPGSFLIELHAPGAQGTMLNVDQAVDRLDLGGDRFYRIIDVAIRRILPRNSVAFVWVSGHAPIPFGETWDPGGRGPFR